MCNAVYHVQQFCVNLKYMYNTEFHIILYFRVLGWCTVGGFVTDLILISINNTASSEARGLLPLGASSEARGLLPLGASTCSEARGLLHCTSGCI